MKNQKGLTLLEVIFMLVIVGASIPPLLVAFSRIQERNMALMPVTTASHLARDQMEELIQGKGFADIDDVALTNFAEPFETYQYQLNVDYVAQDNLDEPTEDTTDYKRVQMVVTNTEVPNVNVNLVTLVVNH